MQALKAIAEKVEANAPQLPAPPAPVNLTFIIDSKTGKTREVTHYERDASGEMTQSVKEVEPVEAE